MSWRDTIKSRSVDGQPLTGKFRSAKFFVPTSEGTFGRRAELHEYPLRNKPWVEDLGRKARQYSIEVFVDNRLGDYLAARDALIAAIEEPGPGTLVHPWHGTMTVALVEPATVRESSREGGRATFRLVLVEAGELTFPASGADTAGAVDERANAAIDAGMADFVKKWITDGLPGWSLAELESDLASTLGGVEELAGGVIDTVAAEIRSPGNMAAAVVGAMQRLYDMVGEPLRAVQLYKPLFGAGDDSPTVPATTTIRKQQAESAAGLHRLTRQTAVVEACRAASRAEYQTRDDALDMATGLLDAIDDQAEAVEPVTGQPIADPVYQALTALRAAVATDLRTRGARLPELAAYTPTATLPALVVAHRIYGDAARDEEIVNRNRIHHPGFVPGGAALEVLNE